MTHIQGHILYTCNIHCVRGISAQIDDICEVVRQKKPVYPKTRCRREMTFKKLKIIAITRLFAK